MWVEFVAGSLLCSKKFFSGYSGFPLSQKPTFPNSNSTRNGEDEEPLCGCATSKSLLLLLLLLSTSKLLKEPLNRTIDVFPYFIYIFLFHY